jgi:hypothetical protein
VRDANGQSVSEVARFTARLIKLLTALRNPSANYWLGERHAALCLAMPSGPDPSKPPKPPRSGPQLPFRSGLEMAFDTRYRDKDGEINRKHGNILIGRLRVSYGSGFAQGCADDDKLSDVLAKLDNRSLSKLVREL